MDQNKTRLIDEFQSTCQPRLATTGTLEQLNTLGNLHTRCFNRRQLVCLSSLYESICTFFQFLNGGAPGCVVPACPRRKLHVINIAVWITLNPLHESCHHLLITVSLALARSWFISVFTHFFMPEMAKPTCCTICTASLGICVQAWLAISINMHDRTNGSWIAFFIAWNLIQQWRQFTWAHSLQHYFPWVSITIIIRCFATRRCTRAAGPGYKCHWCP